MQSDEYRHADPRELVEEGGTTMAGPGGAPGASRRRSAASKSRNELTPLEWRGHGGAC